VKLYQDDGLCGALVLGAMGHGDVERHGCCCLMESGNWGEERKKKLVERGEVELDLGVLLGGVGGGDTFKGGDRKGKLLMGGNGEVRWGWVMHVGIGVQMSEGLTLY
jgi:hypothetical protein